MGYVDEGQDVTVLDVPEYSTEQEDVDRHYISERSGVPCVPTPDLDRGESGEGGRVTGPVGENPVLLDEHRSRDTSPAVDEDSDQIPTITAAQTQDGRRRTHRFQCSLQSTAHDFQPFPKGAVGPVVLGMPLHPIHKSLRRFYRSPPLGYLRPVIAAVSTTPLGAGDSVGELVAGCVRIIRDSGLVNETNAMFTNIEGDYDDVMAVIKSCVDYVTARAPRVSVVVKMDVKGDDPGGRMATKVQTVERHLTSPPTG